MVQQTSRKTNICLIAQLFCLSTGAGGWLSHMYKCCVQLSRARSGTSPPALSQMVPELQLEDKRMSKDRRPVDKCTLGPTEGRWLSI